ncbi:MAG: hypothetical protein QMD65_03780 [Patescibacteria group bacterium]|nr:hypothetical protein [Patescibacteria group bacterium]
MEKLMPQEKFVNFEKQEGRELEPKEKENLVNAWLSIAVDNQARPDDIDKLNNQQLKRWFYETLMDDTEKLIEEWDLQPDVTLIEKIKSEHNLEQRTRLEMDYIEAIRIKVQEFKKTHPLGDRSDKWDSWPSEMRDNKTFNCVGGTVLGISFLDRIGVRSYYGNPFSHVLNVVELSSGEWVYVDFLNNQVKKTKPKKEIMLGGVRTLELEEPDIIYRYVPLLDNSEAVGSIIGNFHSLEHDVKDKKADPTDKREAERLFANFAEQFRKNDFSLLHDTLYPSKVALRRTREMQDEGGRIEKIRSFSSSARKYIGTLDSKQREEVLKEIKTNAEGIRKLFYESNNDVLDKISPASKKLIQSLIRRMRSAKTKSPELYHDFVELFVSR